MGYLNNTTRVLDAILTKKGREVADHIEAIKKLVL